MINFKSVRKKNYKKKIKQNKKLTKSQPFKSQQQVASLPACLCIGAHFKNFIASLLCEYFPDINKLCRYRLIEAYYFACSLAEKKSLLLYFYTSFRLTMWASPLLFMFLTWFFFVLGNKCIIIKI